MLILVGSLGLVIWIYLAFGRGGFWRTGRLGPPAVEADLSQISVVAVVPARDEADVVGRCVASLLQQKQVSIRIVLVDDGSSDGTANVAQRAAEAAGKAHLLTVIAGKPLAAGWSGKLWAVHQGVDHAAAWQPDFVLLTDADIEHSPSSVASLAAIATAGKFEMASYMVRLYCRSFAERALIPAFVFFFFMLYPPAWIADQRRKTAGAAGGSILIRREALERGGGIAAIRAEVIDDCALARRVKEGGGRVWLGLARDTVSIRPYGSFAGIGRMISRSAFNQLRHSWLILIGSMLGMALIYAGPPLLLLLSHRWLPAALGGLAWLLMSVCYWHIVRFYGRNPIWSLTLPLVALFYVGATIHSAVKYSLGRGGEWKGRIQDPANRNAEV